VQLAWQEQLALLVLQEQRVLLVQRVHMDLQQQQLGLREGEALLERLVRVEPLEPLEQ
jgi:hypothetical protein